VLTKTHLTVNPAQVRRLNLNNYCCFTKCKLVYTDVQLITLRCVTSHRGSPQVHAASGGETEGQGQRLITRRLISVISVRV
jgi:hypothetical protein